jgi:hypothetical protein
MAESSEKTKISALRTAIGQTMMARPDDTCAAVLDRITETVDGYRDRFKPKKRREKGGYDRAEKGGEERSDEGGGE